MRFNLRNVLCSMFWFAACLALLAVGWQVHSMRREADRLRASGAYLGEKEIWFSSPRGAGIKFRQLPNGKLVNGSKEFGVNEAISHAEELSSRLKAFGVKDVIVFYEDGKGGLKELERAEELADFANGPSDLRSK
jgi:hypothetical protein